MENVKKGIAVAGSVLVDKIYTISAYPESGQLTQIQSIQKAVGGCVPNVALDLKKLSPELPVYAVGTVGADDDGKFVTQVLKEGNVNADCLTQLPESTSFTDVMSVQGGQRTFFTYAGASGQFGAEHVPFEKIDPKLLHLGYFLLLSRVIVENAMLESALALSKKYGVELADIRAHIEDLLFRFTNEALKDTCQRVGGDPTRKLSPEDRLVGASKLAVQQGVCPCFMAIGAGAAVYRYIKESDDAAQSVERAKQVLESVSGLCADEEIAARILHFYEMILAGADLSALLREADRLKAQARTNVI